MITTTTKTQLVIFAIVTIIGATIVGGRYAEIDRLVVDRTYPVHVELKDSGGIFAGAEVTYRGVVVGKVGSMEYTPEGVRATLDIEKSAPRMSQDTVAIVANKSAIGEQFMDLQPRTNSGPYLRAGSVISASNTVVPLDATRLLIDVGAFVDSVDTDSLQTVVNELGLAFAGYGEDLATIIDSFESFIKQANQSFPETQSLIRGSRTVLDTLVDKRGQFADLTENFSALTETLVDEDDSVRDLLDDGPEATKVVREVVEENSDDLVSIFNSLAPVTGTFDRRWKSLEVLTILFMAQVDGGFAAVTPSTDPKRAGLFDGRIPVILRDTLPGQYEPTICLHQYGGADAEGYRAARPPDDLSNAEVKHYDCLNNDKVPFNPRKTEYNFDRAVVAPATGEESWKSLLLGTASN
jgi:phospholipid/cholesterol/gamma-HCH transport system substrate-binding protein